MEEFNLVKKIMNLKIMNLHNKMMEIIKTNFTKISKKTIPIINKVNLVEIIPININHNKIHKFLNILTHLP